MMYETLRTGVYETDKSYIVVLDEFFGGNLEGHDTNQELLFEKKWFDIDDLLRSCKGRETYIEFTVDRIDRGYPKPKGVKWYRKGIKNKEKKRSM